MPIYEYRCKKCGIDFEEIMGANDPAPACPDCHSDKTEKLVSKACFRSGSSYDGGAYDTGGAHSSSGGCAGCSGGNCASCH
ncbi:zinc ribbon domain-containing protein [Desulfovibrio sp. OttesenSCG-928-O18]|nr:zinc ribbon domain-containing protein [Desulfovibrio sp. OttesenSCG-928-O18]